MDNPLQEHIDLANDWADRTDAKLLTEIRRLNIGETDELYNSLRHRVYQIGAEIVGIDFTFLLRGRFVDMGAGRKKIIQSIDTNRSRLKVRKPKKWYSKPFYGRLNALMGITGATISEQAVAAVVEPLERP